MTDKRFSSEELSLRQLLIDSVFYGGSMSAVILGSLYYNAEMWVGITRRISKRSSALRVNGRIG